jgi:hypothetical protein
MTGCGRRVAITIDDLPRTGELASVSAAAHAQAVACGGRALADRIRSANVPEMNSILDCFEKRSVEVSPTNPNG